MAGFLDKQERIIDMVLTEDGKRLFAAGKLEFSYFAFFDDEVDYSPIIYDSGSLTSAALSASVEAQIEATPVREATHGLGLDRSWDDLDHVNAIRPLFTMPQGQNVLSRVLYDPDVVSGSIQVVQAKVDEITKRRDRAGKVVEVIGPIDRGFDRRSTTTFVVDLSLSDFFDESTAEGTAVSLFVSGSDGYSRVTPKLDATDDLSFGTSMKMYLDGRFRSRRDLLLAGSDLRKTSGR